MEHLCLRCFQSPSCVLVDETCGLTGKALLTGRRACPSGQFSAGRLNYGVIIFAVQGEVRFRKPALPGLEHAAASMA